jgi:hypothetical protein
MAFENQKEASLSGDFGDWNSAICDLEFKKRYAPCALRFAGKELLWIISIFQGVPFIPKQRI